MAATIAKNAVTKTTSYKFGRPTTTKTLVIQKMRDTIANTVSKRQEEITEALIDAAIGITTEQHDRKTGDLYYTEKGPDVQAARALWEYAGLKPSEKIEVQGNIGIVQLIANLEHGDIAQA